MRRKAQGFTLIEIMVVITIIAALVSTVAIVVPKMQEQQRRTQCQGNLQQLCHVYLTEFMQGKGKAQKYSGVSLWLSYRKNKTDIQRGNEKVLICPGDGLQGPDNDEEKKRWDNVDLMNPTADLCSYAARDFVHYPTSIESPDKQIIGCDRQGPDQKTMHHKNTIVVAFDGGDVQFMTREELSISSENNIVIGPEAENAMLKQVAYIVRKTE